MSAWGIPPSTTALKRERDALSRQIRAQEKKRLRTVERARGLSDADLLSIMAARAVAKARAEAKPAATGKARAKSKAKAINKSTTPVLRPWRPQRARCRPLCSSFRVKPNCVHLVVGAGLRSRVAC